LSLFKIVETTLIFSSRPPRIAGESAIMFPVLYLLV